ncbi:adenylate/guanylate cyclase domain-containing protein [Bradyrhizobium diazoefficiens]|uniref:adenylate/guanylate cyclase domain-containing protein n=1 Tax=Bradyrhizobium diazoefficiens TaxID=1355477 RepID=UPI001909A15C|nr:adenylate/guanylate cyclase domain-containing protein [Bradyrhizobium diazoefficiens]MBK3665453.1 adenylate/guanylate cyclase domain-containing protein [Bradyrhizobium diazoefficiens]
MNASDKIPTATQADAVVDWLTNGTRDQRFIDNIFAEMCVRLQQAGIPLKRSTLHILIQHPQWLGARFMWSDGMREADISRVDFDVRERPEYIGSSANEIQTGATEVRENLERDPALGRKHRLYDEMRATGLTDYVAWPLYHTLGKQHLVTFATDRRGGFDDAHIAALKKLLPVLALVSEIRVKNRLARTLLETYVGAHAGELILAGATRRGTGTTVRAAIMICDLRDFTKISDNWPRDDVIDLLNDYFDAMSDPITRHGGEILKFIGDGLLAIFPLHEPNACANLLRAVTEARGAMVALNERNSTTGRAPLNYGIGVHVGDVMYGNIGSTSRLDFTVIGPAVNMASRLEALTKQLGKPVLLSRDFAELVDREFELERVGQHAVRGFSEPIELFAFQSGAGP